MDPTSVVTKFIHFTSVSGKYLLDLVMNLSFMTNRNVTKINYVCCSRVYKSKVGKKGCFVYLRLRFRDRNVISIFAYYPFNCMFDRIKIWISWQNILEVFRTSQSTAQLMQ